MPSQSSERFCGGMLVAMPTAIPEAPLTSMLGSLAGMTTGSRKLLSKLSMKSTVSWSRLARTSSATRLSLASV